MVKVRLMTRVNGTFPYVLTCCSDLDPVAVASAD